VYEWNYQRQMVAIRLAEAAGRAGDEAAIGREIFGRDYLLERPLLRALSPGRGGMPVLLIDEIDRADEPFEAYLLEVLSDFQVSVPELGTIRAPEPPIVVMTSNRTREIHDAIKRRCFYYWVEYPDAQRELAILQRRLPGLPARLARDVVGFAQQTRGLDLFKAPGVSETLDWAEALMRLDLLELDAAAISLSLGILLKYQDDVARVRTLGPAALLDSARERRPDPAAAV
jgi:MoxR-like ATPase